MLGLSFGSGCDVLTLAQNVKLAIGTGNAGGTPSASVAPSSTGDCTLRALTGRSIRTLAATFTLGLGSAGGRGMGAAVAAATLFGAGLFGAGLVAFGTGVRLAEAMCAGFAVGFAASFVRSLAPTGFAFAFRFEDAGFLRAFCMELFATLLARLTRDFFAGLREFVALPMSDHANVCMAPLSNRTDPFSCPSSWFRPPIRSRPRSICSR
jgi:hypothetical protein